MNEMFPRSWWVKRQPWPQFGILIPLPDRKEKQQTRKIQITPGIDPLRFCPQNRNGIINIQWLKIVDWHEWANVRLFENLKVHLLLNRDLFIRWSCLLALVACGACAIVTMHMHILSLYESRCGTLYAIYYVFHDLKVD